MPEDEKDRRNRVGAWKIVLWIGVVSFTYGGCEVIVEAKSAIHQILGGVLVLAAAVMFPTLALIPADRVARAMIFCR